MALDVPIGPHFVSRLAQLVERVTSICNDEVSRSSRLVGILFAVVRVLLSSQCGPSLMQFGS